VASRADETHDLPLLAKDDAHTLFGLALEGGELMHDELVLLIRWLRENKIGIQQRKLPLAIDLSQLWVTRGWKPPKSAVGYLKQLMRALQPLLHLALKICKRCYMTSVLIMMKTTWNPCPRHRSRMREVATRWHKGCSLSTPGLCLAQHGRPGTDGPHLY
jgi:hypothetical protein